MQGSVRKKGDKWYYSLELPPTETVTEECKVIKKRNRIERAGGRTKKEALEALNEAIHKFNNGYIEPKKMSYNEFMAEYLDGFIKEKRKFNTYQRYKDLYDIHIKNHLGGILLKDLTDTHIEKTLTTARKKNLSSTTLQAIYNLVNGSLNHAINKKKYINNNPCKFVERPIREKFKAQTLNTDEIALILSSFDTEDYSDFMFRTVFLTILELGLRRGEVAGLQWQDIDFEKGIVTVQHNYVYSNGKVYMDSIKNDLIGDVTISKELLEELKTWRNVQRKNKLKYGELYIKNIEDGKEMDFVFTWQNGKAIHPNYYTLKFNRLIKALKINKRVRLHDLRHTNATLLIKKGINFKVIQSRLRHADFNTTMNLYSHVTLEMQEEATTALTSILHQTK